MCAISNSRHTGISHIQPQRAALVRTWRRQVRLGLACKANNEEKRIKETQQKIIEVLSAEVPVLLEYRQRYIQALEIQAGYDSKKAQYNVTKDRKSI